MAYRVPIGERKEKGESGGKRSQAGEPSREGKKKKKQTNEQKPEGTWRGLGENKKAK